MVTFDIRVNGTPLYRTGVGDFGLLTAELMWHRIQTDAGPVAEDLSIHATALLSSEHSSWPRVALKVGDEVLIRVVDADEFDEPSQSGPLESFSPDRF